METPQLQIPWFSISLEVLHERLRSSEGGLDQAEADVRLREYGPNKLPEKPPPTVWQIGLRQFFSPLIYTLLIAAAVSALIREPKDADFIAFVLFLNAVVGSYQEWKAERSNLSLRKLLQIRASVQRNGEVRIIPAEEVVSGDIVWLESGNRVPADLRLLSVHDLAMDESLLTGESLPVSKDPTWQGSENAPVGDRANMCFAGSIVMRGRAKGTTVATGTATNVGQLAMGVVGFAAFQWMLMKGWSVETARNYLLLMMVLFENFHLGNCRSETKSDFVLSPLRSPILLIGAITALLIHVTAMYTPILQGVLETDPVSLTHWMLIAALAVTIVPVMELHKWLWSIRHRDT